jgi:uncharacterized membrane protein YphA (DoxX/SURF4 family)
MKRELTIAERESGRIQLARLISRWALGLVWVYEGLVPKILFQHAHPEQTALVAQSAFCLGSPATTLHVLGWAQVALGVTLLSGWRDRVVAAIATGWMGALIVLVGTGRPGMWSDPFGALAKDLCLIACAAVLWLLPERKRER